MNSGQMTEIGLTISAQQLINNHFLIQMLLALTVTIRKQTTLVRIVNKCQEIRFQIFTPVKLSMDMYLHQNGSKKQLRQHPYQILANGLICCATAWPTILLRLI